MSGWYTMGPGDRPVPKKVLTPLDEPPPWRPYDSSVLPDDLPPYRPIGRRAMIVLGLLVVMIVLDLVGIWSDAVENTLIHDIQAGRPISAGDASANDRRQAIVGAVQSGVFIITAAAFLAWFYRAYANLEALGAQFLRFGKNWAVGGWFVPILNLWRPKQVANDIWRASDPEGPPANRVWDGGSTPALMLLWWVAYLASQILYNWATNLTFGADTVEDFLRANNVLLAADAINIIAAVLAIVVVRRMTRRQEARATALELVATDVPRPLYKRRSSWLTGVAVAVVLSLQALVVGAVLNGAIDVTEEEQAAVDDQLLFARDEFSDPQSGWLDEEGDGYSMGYVGGQYRIRVTEKGREQHSYVQLFEPVNGVTVEMTGWFREGTLDDAHGLGCWSGGDAGYFGVIYRDGTYAIVKDPVGAKGPSELATGQMLQARFDRNKNPNLLRFECTGAGTGAARLSLWSNGTLIDSVQDARPLPDINGLGMFVTSNSGRTDVRWDDLFIREVRPASSQE